VSPARFILDLRWAGLSKGRVVEVMARKFGLKHLTLHASRAQRRGGWRFVDAEMHDPVMRCLGVDVKIAGLPAGIREMALEIV